MKRLSTVLSVCLLFSMACRSTSVKDVSKKSVVTDLQAHFRIPLDELRTLASTPVVVGALGDTHAMLVGALDDADRELLKLPNEGTFVAGEGSSEAIGNIAGALMTVYVAAENGTTVDQQTAKRIQTTLKTVRMPELALALRYRSAAFATEAFEDIKSFGDEFVSQTNVRTKHSDKQLHYSVRVGDAASADDISEALLELGLFKSLDKSSFELAEHVRDLSGILTFEVQGDQLFVRFGEKANLEPVITAKPHQLPEISNRKNVNKPFLRAHWNAKGLIGAMSRWKDISSSNSPDSVANKEVQAILSGLEYFGTVGSQVAWFDDDSFNFHSLSEGAKPSTPLNGSGILKLLGQSESFIALSGTSVEKMISDLLLRTEDRIERSLGDEEMFGMTLEKYYEMFRGVRELVFANAERTYPFAMMLTATGKARSMTLGGEQMKVSFGIPEFALVAKPSNPQTLLDYLSSLYRELVAVAGLDSASMVTVAELGLSTKTWRFHGTWIEALLPDAAKFSYDADLVPHMTTLKDFAVFSTSPRLSREFSTSKNQPSNRALKIPENATFLALVTARELSKHVELFESWAVLAGEPAGDTETMKRVLSALDRLTITTSSRGKVSETRGAISLSSN